MAKVTQLKWTLDPESDATPLLVEFVLGIMKITAVLGFSELLWYPGCAAHR